MELNFPEAKQWMWKEEDIILGKTLDEGSPVDTGLTWTDDHGYYMVVVHGPGFPEFYVAPMRYLCDETFEVSVVKSIVAQAKALGIDPFK